MTNHTKNSSLAILLIGFVLLYKLSYQLCLIIIILSIFFVGLFRGVFSLKANYFMPSISKSPLNKCILTFDDGPNEYSLEVLQVLKRHQISALFFVIGKQLELHPEIKEQIVREGHLLGNHTYSHAHNFAFMSSKMVMLELEKTETLLGKHSLKLFRAPVGISNPNIARAVKKMKLTSIAWDLRSFDTHANNSQRLVASMLKKVQTNSLVLMHDNLKTSAENLELFIVKAKEQGIQFTSAEELKSIFHV